MYVIFAAIAVSASVLGLAYANLPRQGEPARWRALTSAGFRPLVVVTALLALVLFLLTLPATPPFSSGLTLGWGFLIGAALGIYALVESAGQFAGDGWHPRSIGLISAACLGPASILLLFHGYPNDALLGCALGAVLAAMLGGTVTRQLAAAATTQPAPVRLYRGVEAFALVTVAMAASARLAIAHAHFPHALTTSTAGGYWVFPLIALLGGALASTLLPGEWRARLGRWHCYLAGLAAAAVAVAITAMLQVKLLPGLAWMMPCYGLLAVGFLQAAFLKEDAVPSPRADYRPVALAFGLVLLILAVVAITFKRLQGYGEALALVPALLIVLPGYLGGDQRREPLVESLGMGGASLLLMFVLYRLFLESTGRGWALNFQQHYDMFAALLGAGASFGLLAFAARGIAVMRNGQPRIGLLTLRAVLLGVCIAVIPVALAILWGVRGLGAFLFGLMVGEVSWMLLAAWTTGADRERLLTLAPQLPFIGAMLVAIQLAPPVLAMELSRTAKLGVVGVITLVAILWISLDAWKRSGRATTATPVMHG